MNLTDSEILKLLDKVRLAYCFTPYQRIWLYNGAPLVAFYDTLGIRRTYSRLKPHGVLTGELVTKGKCDARLVSLVRARSDPSHSVRLVFYAVSVTMAI